MEMKARKCSKCGRVSSSSAEACQCRPDKTRWLTWTFAGLSAIGILVLLVAVVAVPLLKTKKLSPATVEPQRRSQEGETFSSLADETECLMDGVSIEECKAFDRKVANLSPYETVESIDQEGLSWICAMKKMKVQDPPAWALKLQRLAAQPSVHVHLQFMCWHVK